MRSVILLQSLAGSTFCHNAGTLLECDSVEAERLIEAGIARELLSGEPTELQKATKGRMFVAEPKTESQAPQDAIPVSQTPPNDPQTISPIANEPQPKPRRRRS
jgi:hypothetical protein